MCCGVVADLDGYDTLRIVDEHLVLDIARPIIAHGEQVVGLMWL